MFKKSGLFLSLILLAFFVFIPQQGKADPDLYTLTSPTSGASWMMGSTQTVSWTKDPNAGITHLKLSLLFDGADIVTIADIDVPANQTTGSVSWTVPTEYNNGTMIQPANTYRISTWATGQGFSHTYDSASFSLTANPALIPDLTITGFSFAGVASTNAEPIPVFSSESGYHVKINIKNSGTIRALMENARIDIFSNNTLATYHNLSVGFISMNVNESKEIEVFIPATLNVIQLGNANIRIVISNVRNEINTSNNTATRLYNVANPPPASYGVKVTNTPNISSTLSLRRGMTNVSLVDFKIKSIGSEGIKIRKLLFHINQYPLTSLTNFRLYNGTQSWPGQVDHGFYYGEYNRSDWSELTFPTLNTLTIPVGQEFEFVIKADVPSSATIGAETSLDYLPAWSEYIGATSGQGLLAELNSVKVTIGVWETTAPPINNTTSNSETRTIKDNALYGRLKGNILLKTEDSGKAYYIHPSNKKSYYLGRPNDAFSVMREQGVGISNKDLQKIPIGVEQMAGADQDGDALSDLFEDAIGLNKNNRDSDGDGNDDRTEIFYGYNPLGTGRQSVDLNFTKSQRGRILLQVEGRGEAWYVNLKDNKRYFLGRPHDAFYMMQNLGLGISNQDFNKLN
ncbi:MAG TPA: hypothetical protein PK720_01415 [bacterium]|nr:hypothetical protein [bacterium]